MYTQNTAMYYTSPEVYITTNKNRTKVQPDGNIYMKNGTEFQLEFWNRTDRKQKAVITINGKKEAHALVLLPGEHFYLDRFMDVQKKFKFDSYEVDNNPVVQGIVKNNGSVKIEFHNEYIQPVVTQTWTYPDYWYQPMRFGSGSVTAYNSGNSTITNTSFTTRGADVKTSFSDGEMTLGETSAVYNSSTKSFMPDSANIEKTSGTIRAMSMNSVKMSKAAVKANDTMITGRVESGDKSKQEFRTVNYTFDVFPHTTIEYKLMPEENKPMIVTTDEIRTYCVQCGRRLKKNWKFCAGCGNRA